MKLYLIHKNTFELSVAISDIFCYIKRTKNCTFLRACYNSKKLQMFRLKEKLGGEIKSVFPYNKSYQSRITSK